MSIAGSKNTLLGYGAVLPNPAASNQIVIGTASETTHFGGTGGLIVSASALTLSGNTSLTVSGNAGQAGQYLVSGGANAPYWGPKLPQLITNDYTLQNPLSSMYTLSGPATDTGSYKTFTLPTGFAGASVSLKVIDSVSGIVAGSIVNLNQTSVIASLLMSPGDCGQYMSNGTNWYVVSANEEFPTSPSAPTNLVATNGSNSVSISFTPGASSLPITNYQYSYDGNTWTSCNPALTTSPVAILDTTILVNGMTRSVYLRAISALGNGASSAARSVTPTAQFGSTTGTNPIAIAIDSLGNVYTANSLANTVTKILTDGTTAQFGGSTGVDPKAIAIDSSGNVFTANYSSSTVTKILPDGTTAQFGGSTGAYPRGIAIDSLGNVYTANQGVNTVTKITANGSSTAQFGGSTGSNPIAIAIDSSNNVYTANAADSTVTKITADGLSTAQFGGSTGSEPGAIAIDSLGNVYTANISASTVTKITANGSSTAQFGSTGPQPRAIKIDSANNVYTANYGANTVTKITPAGTSTSLFANTGIGSQGIATYGFNVYTSNNVARTVTKIITGPL